MPVHKQDTTRALALLKDYQTKMEYKGVTDGPLRSAIERVVGIFGSDLFRALLDIQEYYELSLLEGVKVSDFQNCVVSPSTGFQQHPVTPPASPCQEVPQTRQLSIPPALQLVPQPVAISPPAASPGLVTVTALTLPVVSPPPLTVAGSSADPTPEKYRYQDEEGSPQERSPSHEPSEGKGPELVHVSEKNLSQLEIVHGIVSHEHISPLKEDR